MPVADVNAIAAAACCSIAIALKWGIVHTAAAHSHVKWAVVTEAEPSVRLVQLHRRAPLAPTTTKSSTQQAAETLA
jgi:hypothetical protein